MSADKIAGDLHMVVLPPYTKPVPAASYRPPFLLGNLYPKMPPKSARGIRKAEGSSDENSVISTNNSAIQSKRSCERVYFKNPHYFRYFVKKPQRRSPLINRGYWLRMKAVDHVVEQFMKESTSKRKVVVNLGCG